MSKKNEIKKIRCAIYTRKSTEERLDLEFNSLDSQRAAAEAFIASQKSEGWVCLPKKYDDGGFSGGDLDRPALNELLKDIAAGEVDCVVVYKVDRLSRSLFDFAKVMEKFDEFGASFVSPCEVIERDDGSLVAVDRLEGETFEVSRDDVSIYRIDVNGLFTHLMNLLGGHLRFDAAMQNAPLRRIGQLPARLGAKTLYFSKCNDAPSLLAAATELSGPQPVVLMVPTLQG